MSAKAKILEMEYTRNTVCVFMCVDGCGPYQSVIPDQGNDYTRHEEETLKQNDYVFHVIPPFNHFSFVMS